MIIKFVKIIVVLLTCLGIVASNTYAQEEISWLITKEPPITDVEDGKFSGYGIDVLKMIHKDLPEYDNVIATAGNYKRLVLEVNKGPLTCALGLFKTDERLKTMHYSQLPVFYFFNIQIVMRKSLFDKLNQPQELSLEAMLQNKDYTLGISSGRTYSEDIRDKLSKYKGAKNIYIGAQSNVAESLLQMLIEERIDYMFLYPEEAMYLSDRLGSKNNIVTVPIAEASLLSSSWAVCSKNEEGLKVIEVVSDSLKKIHKEGKYKELYQKWLSPNLHETYRVEYDKKFH